MLIDFCWLTPGCLEKNNNLVCYKLLWHMFKLFSGILRTPTNFLWNANVMQIVVVSVHLQWCRLCGSNSRLSWTGAVVSWVCIAMSMMFTSLVQFSASVNLNQFKIIVCAIGHLNFSHIWTHACFELRKTVPVEYWKHCLICVVRLSFCSLCIDFGFGHVSCGY